MTPSFQFPPWTSKLRPLLLVGAVGGLVHVVSFINYGFSPKTIDVGYAPEQPVPFSHAIHAGKLGMDCRYCHNTVEQTAAAAIPPTQTCMNCHTMIRTKSPLIAPVQASWEKGTSVPWVRVHDLPDFVYFDHSAHVTRGVGCESCHGRIDQMDVVTQDQTLSMGWCLECHRAPENALRPLDKITTMGWQPEEGQLALGTKLREANHIQPSQDCSTCHR